MITILAWVLGVVSFLIFVAMAFCTAKWAGPQARGDDLGWSHHQKLRRSSPH